VTYAIPVLVGVLVGLILPGRYLIGFMALVLIVVVASAYVETGNFWADALVNSGFALLFMLPTMGIAGLARAVIKHILSPRLRDTKRWDM